MPNMRVVLSKSKKLPSQKWQLKSAGSSTYYIVNAKSCKALTVASPKRANGSKLIQRKLAKTNAQKWVLKGSASACHLVSKCGSDLCVTAAAKKKNNALSLKLKRFDALPGQCFAFKKTSYKLTKSALLNSLGSAKGHINSVAAWSSNDDYKALRSRFGSAPMASFMSYSHVSDISPYETWVSYSPKTLGKLWVGSYWANFKDANKNSSYLRGQYKKGARSFIKGALNSRKSTTTYTKTGWGPFARSGNIYNDAGIVVKDGHPYVIAVMSKAYYHPSQLRELVRAIDTYEKYLRS